MAKREELSSDSAASAMGSVQSLDPTKVRVRHRARPVAALAIVSTHPGTRGRAHVVSDQSEILPTLPDPANENRDEVEDADPPPPYEVGYGRPPKKNQFEKGKSGNPKGRTKGNRNFKSMARDILKEPVTVTRNGKRKKIEGREAVLQVFRNKALNGDFKAAQFLITSAGETSSPGEEPAGAALVAISDADLTILAFSYRSALDEKGFDDQQIDMILAVLGLPTASPADIMSSEVPPDAPLDVPSDASAEAVPAAPWIPAEKVAPLSMDFPDRSKPRVLTFSDLKIPRT